MERDCGLQRERERERESDFLGKRLGRLEKNTWTAKKFEKLLGSLKLISGSPHDEVDLGNFAK